MLSRLLTRKEQAVLLVFAAAIMLGAVAVVIAKRGNDDGTVTLETVTAAAATAPVAHPPGPAPSTQTPSPVAGPATSADPAMTQTSPDPVIVSLQGAVRKPDVYELVAGDRVQDLLEKAGGPLEDANLTNINLAAKLVDGTTLIVPSWNGNDYWSYQAQSNPPQYTIQQQQTAATPIGTAPASVASSPKMPAATGPINLNTATQEQLESLPGIGPTYAQEIIRFRTQTPFRTVDDVGQVRGIGPKRLEAIRPLVTVQ